MKIPLEFETSADENRRLAFRIATQDRVKMHLAGEQVVILDISETGIAFETDATLSGALKEVELFFQLGERKFKFTPQLEVTFCGQGRCGAKFGKLSERAHVILSELVVLLQKQQIRESQKLAEQQI